MDQKGLGHVDGIAFINLAHRQDRRETLLRELERVGSGGAEVVRVEAVYDLFNGVKGCYQSHLAALRVAKEKGWNRFAILEDDCVFLGQCEKVGKVLEIFFQELQEEWDVFFLGGNYLQVLEHSMQFCRVVSSRRAHAYVVNRPYLKTLEECFQKGYYAVKDHWFANDSFENALDIFWNPWQRKGRWYAPFESLAEQGVGFSDILHKGVSRSEWLFNGSSRGG